MANYKLSELDLQALKAVNERLVKRRRELEGYVDTWRNRYDAIKAQRDELRASNESLVAQKAELLEQLKDCEEYILTSNACDSPFHERVKKLIAASEDTSEAQRIAKMPRGRKEMKCEHRDDDFLCVPCANKPIDMLEEIQRMDDIYNWARKAANALRFSHPITHTDLEECVKILNEARALGLLDRESRQTEKTPGKPDKDSGMQI